VSEDVIKAHKQNNIRGVLALIRSHDTFSVAEISHQIKLSKTTVKKTIDLLTAMKLVVSAGKGESTEEGGKKPELYRFNRNFGYVISLHVTPDAIIAMTADLCAAITCYTRSEVTTERELDFILDLLVEIIRGFVAMKASGAKSLLA
jgi:predicted transcriptional regulator